MSISFPDAYKHTMFLSARSQRPKHGISIVPLHMARHQTRLRGGSMVLPE